MSRYGRSVAVIAMALASALTGCAGRTTANEGNFAAAIDEYLSTPARQLCFGAPSFPNQNPNPHLGGEQDTPAEVEWFQEMVQAGIVSETQQSVPSELNPSETRTVTVFDLTPLGKAHYSTDPNPNLGPMLHGGLILTGRFCFAQIKVGKIVNFTEPGGTTGAASSTVTWTPAIASIEPWADQLLAAKKLPPAQQLVDQIASSPPLYTVALDLTNKGWAVREGSVASSSSGAGQDAAPASVPSAMTPTDAASPVASAEASTLGATTPLGTAAPDTQSSGQPSAAPTLAPPASSEVRAFSPAAVIAAFAALPGSTLTQGDGVAFALFSNQGPERGDYSTYNKLTDEFRDDFAAHRNAPRYLPLLKSSAKPMGVSTEDFPVRIGEYDFGSKSFPVFSDTEFVWQRTCNCAKMPDGSALYYYVVLHIDRRVQRYALDPGPAEAFQKALSLHQYSEHLVFYPVAISRSNDNVGRLGIHALVHVTKIVLEERPQNAPMSAAPTILMSTDLQ